MREGYRRLQRWHIERKGRAQIPEELWAAAGELVVLIVFLASPGPSAIGSKSRLSENDSSKSPVNRSCQPRSVCRKHTVEWVARA
jgi:hypothetical protein